MKFDAKSVIQDIESGLTDHEIKAKYGLSDGELARVHADRLNADKFVEDEIECTQKEDFLYPSDSAFERIYDSRSIGTDERKRIECERAQLVKAVRQGIITMDQFKERIKLLISSLLQEPGGQ